MSKTQVSGEQIGLFLEGRDPQKYIVGIEPSYQENTVSLIINDPEKGKYIQKAFYKPFLWLKHEMAGIMYGGVRKDIKRATEKFKVKITELKTQDENGFVPDRLKNGYKYLAKCEGTYNDLLNFFREGGVDVFSEEHKRYFMAISPTEQFLIQTGKRLFKGFEEYEDLHRFQFDLETTGLFPNVNSIFQIGIRDNRGFERIIEVTGNTEKEKRDNERAAIKEFFNIIDALKPDLIAGYNSENFDWDFFYGRCERLGVDITEIAYTLNNSKIKRRESQLKLGGNVERYLQTYMWGYNIVDVLHSVRRAQAINSDIKKAGLKYITKFSKIAKPNRVYIPGDRIHRTWEDTSSIYYLNESNGDWFRYNHENTKHTELLLQDNHGYKQVTGAYVVQRYLLDDLWETEQVDARFNQASFLLAKLIPTSYMRSSTMGTAGIWKLIMLAWSYENNLGIPELQHQETFTGGLSRLLEVGFAKNVAKLDYAALYPNVELTHNVFPDIDITGVMKGMLLYIAETRDIYKKIMGDHKARATAIKKEIEANKDYYSKEKLAELEAEMNKEQGLADKYDKKQLPVKILANSFFGSFGAPHIFPWGDLDCAEETTCRGRQYLRLMVRHFHEKHGFKPLVGDTDGFNFAIPDNIDNFKYVAKGSHRLTKQYEGQEICGLDAVVAEFNENYMMGRMGLDVDDICNTTINFARKNYANDINGKIKLVGNTIKSKKMPIYIEEFLDKGIRLLLDGKGSEFIDLYNNTVDKIANYEIPLVKIASKSSVRTTVSAYKAKMTKTNKAGNPNSRQAHMELIILNGLDLSLGETVYYVNTGKTKSQGDIKAKKLDSGKTEIEFFCKLIPTEQIENDPDLTTDEYNAPKYLNAFNKRIKPLLVCFQPEIRDKILVEFVKDRKTKEMVLEERNAFTSRDCELCSGKPYNETDQDSYQDLMTMEDKELAFWTRVNKTPNNIDLEEWQQIKTAYVERMRAEKLEAVKHENEYFDRVVKRLEIEELDMIKNTGLLPKEILIMFEVAPEFDENGNLVETYLVSNRFKNDVKFKLTELFTYEQDAIERAHYYNSRPTEETNYDSWVAYRAEQLFYTGTTTTLIKEEVIPKLEPEMPVEADTAPLMEDNQLPIPKGNLIDEFVKKRQIKLTEEETDNWNF